MNHVIICAGSCFLITEIAGHGSLWSLRLSQRIGFSSYEINTHVSPENLETRTQVHAGVRIEHTTVMLPGQSDNFVVTRIERKALSRIPFEIRVDKVLSTLEEMPGVVELDSW